MVKTIQMAIAQQAKLIATYRDSPHVEIFNLAEELIKLLRAELIEAIKFDNHWRITYEQPYERIIEARYSRAKAEFYGEN